MQKVTVEGLGPVFRLVYRSRATLDPRRRPADLEAIFEVARSTNAGLGVTGALLAWQDAFVQVLEGEEAVVRRLYASICTDRRHTDVVLLDADTVPDRVFARWWMARVGDGEGADIPVALDRPTAHVVPDVPMHDDPRRATMLDLMREYARVGTG